MEALIFILYVFMLLMIGYYVENSNAKIDSKKDISKSYIEGFKDGYNNCVNQKSNIEKQKEEFDKYKNICADIMNELNELRIKLENNENK